MSHKYVSNKAVMKNEGFLAKLGSTLMTRTNPDPLIETKTQSSIAWRKTSDVKARIKTATGTIAIYDDMTPEEIAELEQQATLMAGGSAPELSGVAATAVQTVVLAAGIGDHGPDTKEGPVNDLPLATDHGRYDPSQHDDVNNDPLATDHGRHDPSQHDDVNDLPLATDHGRHDPSQHDDEDDEIDLLIEAIRPLEGEADQMLMDQILMDLTLSSLLDVDDAEESLGSPTDGGPHKLPPSAAAPPEASATPANASVKNKNKCSCCVIQ
nr:uncharacterized protein LOC123748273 [Procambarus clarkii]